MPTEPWNWTTDDLKNLIGQAESVRLDFKQSRLLNESHERITNNLSREVSAFANTEGGTIVIGIIERHEGKARIADRFDDGVDIKTWSPERIQQLCESNISPPLRGLRVKAIPLDEARTKHAVAVYVPQGNTVYQARDRRYYGRSEYESKPLLDHEIRLLMFRGKTPNAVVKLTNCHKRFEKQPATQTSGNSLSDTEVSLGASASQNLATYFFNLVVENIGEINITEFKVAVTFSPEGTGKLHPFSQAYKDGWPEPYGRYGLQETPPMRPMKVNIYPSDSLDVTPRQTEPISIDAVRDAGLKLHWTLYLSNMAPVSGVIDLVSVFEQAKVIE